MAVECLFFFFQAEDGIRDYKVTGVQTCALPISCQHADVCSLIKAILKHFIRLQLDSQRLVDFPPEELEALGAGGVAGVGEAMGISPDRRSARAQAAKRRDRPPPFPAAVFNPTFPFFCLTAG